MTNARFHWEEVSTDDGREDRGHLIFLSDPRIFVPLAARHRVEAHDLALRWTPIRNRLKDARGNRLRSDRTRHPWRPRQGSARSWQAVVDPESLRVHRVEGLRVVDAPVMPKITNAKIDAPTAEKTADEIRGSDTRRKGRLSWQLNGTELPLERNSRSTRGRFSEGLTRVQLCKCLNSKGSSQRSRRAMVRHSVCFVIVQGRGNRHRCLVFSLA